MYNLPNVKKYKLQQGYSGKLCSCGPLAQKSVLLLTFVTTDKSKVPRRHEALLQQRHLRRKKQPEWDVPCGVPFVIN